MAKTSEGKRSSERTIVDAESEAVMAGTAAALAGALVGAIVFAGARSPIWGGFSLGLVAAAVVLVLSVASSYVGYWRSRNIVSQSWRLNLRPWKFIVDATAVAGVHAVTAAILTIIVFIVVQLSFKGLVVDGWTSAICLATATGLTTYYIYLSVTQMNTTKMATLLILFMAVSVLTSMATAQDPQWWQYNFSYLGTFGDHSSGLFNLALIIGGGFVTTFALYLYRDIDILVRGGVLRHRTAPRTVSVIFVVMGVFLACVGAFPFNQNPIIHNSTAIGMAVLFLALLIASPRLLRGMPGPFFAVTGGFIAALIGGAILFGVTHYFNLAAFELVAFIIIFGWISTFIRFVSATVDQHHLSPTKEA